MSQPLPIPGLGRYPNTTAVDIGMIESETRIPAAAPFRGCAGQIGRIVDIDAKAGRADHGAVGAGETSGSDIIPARVFAVGIK